MIQRWLVIYQQRRPADLKPGMNWRDDRPTSKAALIDDDGADGKVNMPYGIEPSQVADDCERILAIILCADAPNLPFVVIDDKEFTLGQPNEDIPAA